MTQSQSRGSALIWLTVGPALVVTVLLFVVPLVVMGVISLTTLPGSTEDGISSGWSFDNYTQFWNNPSYFKAMTNSLAVTGMVTVLSVVLAYPFAWILAMLVPERWQRLALVLAVLPFWTSYVVRSYAWLLVLAEKGVINQALMGSGLLSSPLTLANTRTATIIGFVHFFVMLLTLTIYANLKQLSPSYAKAAADLGANPLQTFWHVVLPLTVPGIMVGAFLTFVLTIGDYVTPQILGGNNELLMPQLIMLQIGRRGDFPSAAALSMILMVVVTMVYLASARWLKLERA